MTVMDELNKHQINSSGKDRYMRNQLTMASNEASLPSKNVLVTDLMAYQKLAQYLQLHVKKRN